MSEPAEERVSELLRPLREAETAGGEELVQRISRTARWQRSVRRAFVAAAGFGGGLADGVSGLWRGRR
jgi:hypothetical protein